MITPPPAPDSVAISVFYLTCLCALAFGLVGFILRAYPREHRK